MKFLNIFEKIYLADCGHETFMRDEVTAFGKSKKTTIPIINGKAKYCHRCLEKMATRCAWCKEIIFIGDPVTLRFKKQRTPGGPGPYEKESSLYVGCANWHCSGIDQEEVKFWYPPGIAMLNPQISEMRIITT